MALISRLEHFSYSSPVTDKLGFLLIVRNGCCRLIKKKKKANNCCNISIQCYFFTLFFNKPEKKNTFC